MTATAKQGRGETAGCSDPFGVPFQSNRTAGAVAPNGPLDRPFDG